MRFRWVLPWVLAAAALPQPAAGGTFVFDRQCQMVSESPPRYRLWFDVYKTHPFPAFCRMRIEPRSNNGSPLQPIVACRGTSALPGAVEPDGSALYQPAACMPLWYSFTDSLWIEVGDVPAYFVATIDSDDPSYIHSDDVDFPCENPVGVGPTPFGDEVRLAVAPNPARVAGDVVFAQSREGLVSIRVFDMAGRSVRSLVDRVCSAGEHRLSWDLRDDAGRDVPTGLYLVRLETDAHRLSRCVLRLH